MRFHLEGMGIQGCLLAHFLDRAGYDFTWHDIGLPQTAWKASTGAIYPGGSEKFGDDARCLKQWDRWYREGIFDETVLEPAFWWFNHKTAPPHEGRYKPSEPTEHGLRRAPMNSYHFNAQEFVPRTKARFQDRRAPATEPGRVYVVTHGWSERQVHVYWGWTRLVELEYDPEVYGRQQRPSFYFREGRFIMAYAYPVAGTPYWYAGSNIIKQMSGRSRSLEIPPKYERWKANFERLGNGAVRVKAEADMIEGWRPCARDASWAKLGNAGAQVTLRPLWNNGIRHFPQQLEHFCNVLLMPNYLNTLEEML